MSKQFGIKIGAFFLIGIFLGVIASSKLLTLWIHANVQKSCRECSLRIDVLQLNWIPFQVMAKGVHFKSPPNSSLVVNCRVEKLRAEFSLLSFLKDAPTLQELYLTGAEFTLQESDRPPSTSGPPYPLPGSALKSLPAIRVNHILISQSQFNYEHVVRGTPAKIHVEDIGVKIGKFVTKDFLLEEGYRIPLAIDANAVLERSGKAKIHISFDPFAEKNNDSITIEIHKQDLAKLNPFFLIDDGIELGGILDSGLAQMKLSEGHLTGELTAAYQDIQLKFKPQKDRSPVESFLNNLIQSALISKTRPRKGEKSLPQAPISADRRPHESIFKLLIRGLRDAAKQILTN